MRELSALAIKSPEESAADNSSGNDPPKRGPSLSVKVGPVNPQGLVSVEITTSAEIASLRINGDELGGRKDGRYLVERFVQIGRNKLEILAVDQLGNVEKMVASVDREALPVSDQAPALNPMRIKAAFPRDAVAVIIGIETYRKVSSADYANRDAAAFYDYAIRALGVPVENIRLLLDEKADAAEVLRSVKNWLPTKVKRNSTDVYLFYSGHGLPAPDGGSLYLLPYEADRDFLARTAISQGELVAAIQEVKPKSVIMFIDSCYSGQSRTGEALLASARPIAVLAKQATSFPQNFTVISASAPDQISSSSPELKHGIFSYYLMRGMEGDADANKDKQITVGEMQEYLAEKVSSRALGMNRTQQPQVVGNPSRVLVAR
jgi:hypothetical protein